MKKGTIFLGIIIVGAGLTAMSFKSNAKPCQSQDKESEISKDEISEILNEPYSFNKEVELFYSVIGNYRRPVAKRLLLDANSLSDIIENYPSNWIKNYTAVEITSITKGVEIIKTGRNEKLTNEQKDLLASSVVGTTINIKVKYKRDGAVDKSIEDREMNVSMSLVPEVEAKFEGGYDKLIDYLKDNSKGKLNLDNIEMEKMGDEKVRFPGNVRILFTINKKGGVENLIVEHSSNNVETDKIILDLISKMPEWIPAKNSEGNSIDQDFLFLVGTSGC